MQKKDQAFIYAIIILTFISLSSFCTLVAAQDLWTALPPYNLLWPLWSPALSPPDALGVPTPLITTLTSATVLPVEPAIVWDPALPEFYILYNSVGGLQYYDLFYGAIFDWPPRYLLTVYPTGNTYPEPIPLPSNYATLIFFDPALWINTWVPIANDVTQSLVNPTAFLTLLTPADLLPTTFFYSATYTIPITIL